MKNFTLMVILGAALLSGCAATKQNEQSSQATASDAPVRQAVPIPAASAKKLVLVMTGAKTSTDAKDWSSFKEEWRATFADHAKDAGIAFSLHDGDMRPQGEMGTLLSVNVNDYRMVGIGARIFFGAMTGNAYIDAKATFSDLKTGKPFGTQDFNTSSSAWHGVFGKMTPQQVDAIATEVFRELKAAN